MREREREREPERARERERERPHPTASFRPVDGWYHEPLETSSVARFGNLERICLLLI